MAAGQKEFSPRGVIPACLLPFKPDLSIDEPSLRAHLRHVAAVPGVTAITINAHSTEVASCTFDEQRRVLDITAEAIGDRTPIVHGVYADGSLEAARIARMAGVGGASALLVFPPGPFTLGHTTEMALTHVRAVAEASSLPIILFQYPLATRQGYRLETLLRLCDEVPSVRAIKDWCNDVPLHERHIQALQSRTPRVSVLTTHSAWLFPSLVLGCDGLLSGAGSVIADLQAQLFAAVTQNDLTEAKRVHQRIRPLAQAFYADPFGDMHNRMKAALALQGLIPCAAVRPPLVAVGPAERATIRAALIEACLLDEAARQAA